VAIVGSGPAGISAAYYLRIAGHKVTVYDRMPEAGGILMYVIPEYRLPKDIVRRIVKSFTKIGIEFKLKSDVGKDISLDELTRRYDSTFISTGAWNPVSIGLKGEESARFGMEFLTEIGLGAGKAPGEKVLVIGGGNAAIDVAVSALRLGAKEATLACLECREEMPAHPWEIELAVEEGVRIMPSWGPQKIITSAGKVTGLELVRCTSVYDSKRCFAPAYDKNITEIVNADTIMMAVGYSTDLGFLGKEIPVKVNRGLITVAAPTQETGVPGIFAGGTVVQGPVAAIETIASGRRAAVSITSYLTGAAGTGKTGKAPKPLLKFNSSFLKRTEAARMPARSVAERKIDIEDNLGLSDTQAHEEANRCFNCSCLSLNPSDLGLVLVTLGAKIKIVGTSGTRTVPAEEFFDSVKSRLAADEMVTEIQVPKPPVGAKQTFIKFRLRKSVDFPMVSVASVIDIDKGICRGARIALGAVAPRPVRIKAAERLLLNKAITGETVQAASEAVVQETIPLNKNAYKIKIMKTLLKRALLY
jgi:CO/xanthine dehydrogenase FAD-binding subunit